jgi:quercetin dioxygenase-like cupin family protein
MGTEQIAAGTSIPVHMHEHEDEIIFIHRGQGTATVGEEIVPVKEGATVYVPKGIWHAVQNDEARSPSTCCGYFRSREWMIFFATLAYRMAPRCGRSLRKKSKKRIASMG